MLVTVRPQQSLWEAILPVECLGMNSELAAVDRLLDDPRFFEPYRAFFDPIWGRPSVPVETYLRLMFLKVRYGLSYEAVCREVSDSIMWQRFCRIPLGERVPDRSTLIKTTGRCGTEAVAALNEALLAKAHQQRLVKLDQVRADTTVVEANVVYPTDSGLLAKAIARMGRLVGKIQAAGGARRTRFRNRTRSAGRRAREIASKLKLRSDDAKAQVLSITGELARLAELTAADAERVMRNARRQVRRAGIEASEQLGRLVGELDTLIGRTRQVIGQTRTRLGGTMPDGASRVVSLHDPDARPIAKGRLGKPVEFGYKAQLVDNRDGIIVDHHVLIGNPPDAGLLAPAITRIAARFGRVPRAVTADRAYGEAAVETSLHGLGVKTVAIPRKGRPGKQRREDEHSRPFRRLIKWRTGCEGRISYLKHSYGCDRTLSDTIAGAQTWCGWAVLTHNSIKITQLTENKTRRTTTRRPPRPPGGLDPPTTLDQPAA
jgi:transposase, IS5 family